MVIQSCDSLAHTRNEERDKKGNGKCGQLCRWCSIYSSCFHCRKTLKGHVGSNPLLIVVCCYKLSIIFNKF